MSNGAGGREAPALFFFAAAMDGGARRSERGSRGFTLAELLMVLVVIGVIAVLAKPRASTDPIGVSAQADQLAGDIRYAQALAMTKGQRYIISFDTPTSYQLRDSTGAGVAHPLSGATGPVALASGVTLAAALTPAGNAIAFDGLGVPYSYTAPAVLNGALTAQATLTLTQNAAARQVTVAPQTGMTAP